VRVIGAIPAAGLLAGAAAGLFFPDLPVVFACLLLAASLASSLRAWRLQRPGWLGSSVALGFFIGGAMLSSVASQRASRPPLRVAFEELARAARAHAHAEGRRMPEDDEAFAVVEGVLRADAARTPAGVSLSLETDVLVPPGAMPRRAQVSGGLLVTAVGSLAPERIRDWRAGRRVRLPVQLRRPSRYLDPGVPDHERALAQRGTKLVGTVKSGALIEVLQRGSWASEILSALRASSRRAIGDAVGRWSPQSAAIVAAIVLGDRAGLSNDIERRLQEAGTYHVIAISGGNIAILAGLLLGAFRTVGWLGRTAMMAAIASLVAYAALVEGGASVDRATMMAVVYLGARALDHRSPPLNALAVVAGVLAAIDPLAIADPAFLLTVGATLAILTVVPRVVRARPSLPRVLSAPIALFAASAAAEMMLFPLGAALFSRVTFAGLGLNFLAIPLMGVAQLAGMAVVPLALVSSLLATAAGWVAHAGAAGLVWSADLVRFAPALTYRVAPPSPIAIVIYYGAVSSAWMLWQRRKETIGSAETARARRCRNGATLVAGAAAAWILIDPRALASSRGDGRLHVTFIDVGQGDAVFVRFPRGSALLADAGGLPSSSTFDVGDRVVAPAVRAAGVRRLDYVALTHGDPDHIGGALSIVSEFRPREVWEGIPVPRFVPLTDVRLQAQASGARWANVYNGDHVGVDGVDVIVRHPSPADWERQKVRNDDSIVLDLRWRDVSIVLTGDIGKEVERTLIGKIPPARVRVMKVPHHGSLTSSTTEFVTAMHPDVAVVSAGRGNHFGHPVPEVLDRYRRAGAEIFRTDQDGAVTVHTDGTSIDVDTFTGRHLSKR
jgi:competence protein ComEC